ncbi:hypothetical protein BsWGS_27314 [Bradybaena similaris]
MRQSFKKHESHKFITCRQLQFFGHVMRRNKLENLITTGTFDGEMAKGRLRSKYLDGLSASHKRDRNTYLIPDSVDRVKWQTMTLNETAHDDDYLVYANHSLKCVISQAVKCLTNLMP